MKIKVREASGVVLDWLVAKCEGSVTVRMFENSKGFRVYKNESMKQQGIPFAPSTDWSQGGPIIEREMIATSRGGSYAENFWCASKGFSDERAYGPTPLTAACRCYVASKLGEEVEVPDELA